MNIKEAIKILNSPFLKKEGISESPNEGSLTHELYDIKVTVYSQQHDVWYAVPRFKELTERFRVLDHNNYPYRVHYHIVENANGKKKLFRVEGVGTASSIDSKIIPINEVEILRDLGVELPLRPVILKGEDFIPFDSNMDQMVLYCSVDTRDNKHAFK